MNLILHHCLTNAIPPDYSTGYLLECVIWHNPSNATRTVVSGLTKLLQSQRGHWAKDYCSLWLVNSLWRVKLVNCPLYVYDSFCYSLLCHLVLLLQPLSGIITLIVGLTAPATGCKRWDLLFWPPNNEFHSTCPPLLKVVWFVWRGFQIQGFPTDSPD